MTKPSERDTASNARFGALVCYRQRTTQCNSRALTHNVNGLLSFPLCSRLLRHCRFVFSRGCLDTFEKTSALRGRLSVFIFSTQEVHLCDSQTNCSSPLEDLYNRWKTPLSVLHGICRWQITCFLCGLSCHLGLFGTGFPTPVHPELSRDPRSETSHQSLFNWLSAPLLGHLTGLSSLSSACATCPEMSSFSHSWWVVHTQDLASLQPNLNHLEVKQIKR